MRDCAMPGMRLGAGWFDQLVANCAIYSTAVDLTAVINQLIAGGRNVDPEDVATLSPRPPRTRGGRRQPALPVGQHPARGAPATGRGATDARL
jgi:hypothetical protein